MPSFIRPYLLACLALLVPSAAWSQMGGNLGSGSPVLSSSDFAFYFESYDPSQKAWVQMNATQQQHFFNRARCECAGDITNYSGYVRIVIQPASGTPQKIQALLTANLVSLGTGRLFAGGSGINCLNPGAYAGSISSLCTNLLDPSNYTASFPMTVFETQRVYESPPISVVLLYNSLSLPACGVNGTCDTMSACASTASAQYIQFWAQTSSSFGPDRDDLQVALDLVGRVPYAPIDVTAAGGNEALVVDWSWPVGFDSAQDTSFVGVQVFCQRGADAQVFNTGTFAQSFMTSALLCPDTAPVLPSNGAFGNLDSRYLCSGLIPPPATSHRITGLQNGIPYVVGIAAVDKFGNVSEISNITYAAPISTTSVSTARYGNQGCSCELVGRRGLPGAFASLLGMGLLVARLRRRR
jgi:hypothetical protein